MFFHASLPTCFTWREACTFSSLRLKWYVKYARLSSCHFIRVLARYHINRAVQHSLVFVPVGLSSSCWLSLNQNWAEGASMMSTFDQWRRILSVSRFRNTGFRRVSIHEVVMCPVRDGCCHGNPLASQWKSVPSLTMTPASTGYVGLLKSWTEKETIPRFVIRTHSHSYKDNGPSLPPKRERLTSYKKKKKRFHTLKCIQGDEDCSLIL